MAVTFNLKVSGTKRIKKNLLKANRLGKSALTAALYQEGQQIARDSRDRTPIDTGLLRDTIYVRRPRIGNPDVEIGYGAFYAVFVHERTELRHKVGSAKFLQRAINRAMRGYVRRITARTSKNIKSKSGISRVKATFPTTPKQVATGR